MQKPQPKPSLLTHILRHREVYLFPLLAALLVLALLITVPLLTGRAVIDDPGAIVGWAYNFAGIVILSIGVGQVQEHLFGFRSDVRHELDVDQIPHITATPPPFRDDVFDACVTCFLFVFFGWLLWH
ncbi:MAG TPA: hypothetical protein VF614_05020 [Chthoniobacteraceae bacterium]|jgi:hypothetical protein